MYKVSLNPFGCWSTKQNIHLFKQGLILSKTAEVKTIPKSSSKDNRVFGGNFARRSGHKTVLHRSAAFHRKGTLQLLQNGPRIMGKETKLPAGQVINVYIKEPVKIE